MWFVIKLGKSVSVAQPMSHCAKCARSYEGDRCPLCGDSPVLSTAQVNQFLKKFTWMLFAGLAGSLVAARLYPPLDMNSIMFVCVVTFFMPILLHLGLAVRKRLRTNLGLLEGFYKWTGTALIVIAALLLTNGAVDRSPGTQVYASVIRKSVARGRYGSSYSLIVSPSWREGRIDERLEVSGATFSSVRTGQTVAIRVRRGAVGLAWFSEVMPR
jgi:hypothetical protein